MSCVIIPARFASSRFPGKALADIAGKPMIVRVAERCLRSEADSVVVVTDDGRIEKACSSVKGIAVLMSPADLPTGTDRVAFAAAGIGDDIIINVQGDEPFVPPELINRLIKGLENDEAVNMITACTDFRSASDAENPAHVKTVLSVDDFALYFSRCPIPYDRDGSNNTVRYRHIGIYGFRRSFLFRFASSERTPLEKAESLEQLRALENGVPIKVIKTDYDPVSVDTPEDLNNAVKRFIEGSL